MSLGKYPPELPKLPKISGKTLIYMKWKEFAEDCKQYSITQGIPVKTEGEYWDGVKDRYYFLDRWEDSNEFGPVSP